MSGPDLDSLYRGELKAVHGFLWRLGARESEMEDLAHDVFLTAARRLPTFDRERPVRPWLLGITFRTFSEHRRRARPKEHEREVPDLEAASPERTVELRQAQRILLQALATLPMERRTAFVLNELEGLTVSEVAEVMEAPLPTTYTRLAKARDEVSQAVRRFAVAEERRGGAR